MSEYGLNLNDLAGDNMSEVDPQDSMDDQGTLAPLLLEKVILICAQDHQNPLTLLEALGTLVTMRQLLRFIDHSWFHLLVKIQIL